MDTGKVRRPFKRQNHGQSENVSALLEQQRIIEQLQSKLGRVQVRQMTRLEPKTNRPQTKPEVQDDCADSLDEQDDIDTA